MSRLNSGVGFGVSSIPIVYHYFNCFTRLFELIV
nr:MAG TPA: hypothetical protein [Caudoviricetes sp.]